jgi:hypothetical protein
MDDGTRPHDWNRVEFELAANRTMTQIIRETVADAWDRHELAVWATANDNPMIEAECPICQVLFCPDDLPEHVGSDLCARTLVELQIIDLLTEPAQG